jgi:hypothetical protein
LVVLFLVLLLLAGAILASGDPYVANEIAVYAFYALVIDVAVQIVVIVKKDRKRAKTDHVS